MTEAEWLTTTHPVALFDRMEGPHFLRKRRLFLCAECRRETSPVVAELFGDVLDAIEGYIDVYVNPEQWRFFREQVVAVLGSSAGGLPTQVQRVRWIIDDVMQPHLACPLHYSRAVAKKPAALAWQANVVRDLIGNPFRPVTPDPAWLTSTTVGLAAGIYADGAFDRLPILADALQDAGCESEDVLGHCRGPGPHVRGCWVVDRVLGKE